MNDYSGLIILLVICWLIQIGLTYFQHKSYTATLNQIKKRNDGYLGVGVAKAKFKAGRGVITLLVTDTAGTILDYQEMAGFTVFARFKQKQHWIGQNATDVAQAAKGRQAQAFNQAFALIRKEILKTED